MHDSAARVDYQGGALEGVSERQELLQFLRRGKPELGLGESHPNADRQIPLVEGLEEKSLGAGRRGSFQGPRIGIGREIEHGYAEFRLNLQGRLDAVDLPLEVDIHEHEIGGAAGDGGKHFFPRADDLRDEKTEPLQIFLDLHADDRLILDYEYFFIRHFL